MMAGKWYRLAGWDIRRDRERRMRDFVQNLQGEREMGSKSD